MLKNVRCLNLQRTFLSIFSQGFPWVVLFHTGRLGQKSMSKISPCAARCVSSVAADGIQAVRLHCVLSLAIGSGMALRWGHDIIRISLPSWERFSISPENKTCCSCRVITSTGRSACRESNVSGVFAQSLGPPPPHTVLNKQMHSSTERLKLRATATPPPDLVQKVKRPLWRVFSYRVAR